MDEIHRNLHVLRFVLKVLGHVAHPRQTKCRSKILNMGLLFHYRILILNGRIVSYQESLSGLLLGLGRTVELVVLSVLVVVSSFIVHRHSHSSSLCCGVVAAWLHSTQVSNTL